MMHPDTLSAVAHWYRLMKRGHFRSLAHLRETFPSADLVGKLTVFNIGGNKVRLIAALHYNRGRYIFAPSSLTLNTTPELGRNDRHP